MTLDEAVKEAEFRDRDVFVFRDLEGTVMVLHRKRDGKMELIEAPIEPAIIPRHIQTSTARIRVKHNPGSLTDSGDSEPAKYVEDSFSKPIAVPVTRNR